MTSPGRRTTRMSICCCFRSAFLQGYRVTEEHLRGQASEVGAPRFATVLERLASIRQTLVLGMIDRRWTLS
jgi:hypothetical protein